MRSPCLQVRVSALLAALLLIAAMAAGCASAPISTAIDAPFKVPKDRPEEKEHVRSVLAEIDQRNKTVESDPKWIAKAYEGFMIKNLDQVSESDYAQYAQYLDHGAVYIIVHPDYYTFFRESVALDDYVSSPSRNAVELLLQEPAYSSKTRLEIAQEKAMRDFLEYTSTDKKLVIVVLPRYYRTYVGYRFRGDSDEFMRYINEVTNGSDSVLYLYSKRPNRGMLAEKERRKLLKFLYDIKAKEILLGGGYVGRCLEEFYKDIEQYYSDEKLYIVPGIVAFSPADLSSGTASDMLTPEGMIDLGKLSKGIRTNSLGNQGITPRLRTIGEIKGYP